MTIPDNLLDALMKEYKNPEDLMKKTGYLSSWPYRLYLPRNESCRGRTLRD